MKTKRAHLKAVRATVSMPPVLHDRATEKQKLGGYSAFSDYIQDLIRRDAMQQSMSDSFNDARTA